MAKKEKQDKPQWIEYKGDEIKKVIVDLANTGQTASEIGMTLRDSYGIPNVKKAVGARVEEVLAEKNLLPDMPRDLLNLIRRSVMQYRHMNKNKHDKTVVRGYTLTVSKIRRLTDYYARKGKLDKGWRYTPEAAELLVK